MTMEKITTKTFESNPEIAVAPPAVELFASPAITAKSWPPEVANNQEFLRQIESRKKLNANLDSVLSRLPRPDISLQEAVAENNVTEDQVAKLYASLSELLEGDPEYQRIVLYIPFEFLPAVEWKPISAKLRNEAAQFRSAYMNAWNNLLIVQDVRANFVDGDVLEVKSRKGDLPRVVKAAHFIPKLVEKNFLRVDDVFRLLETSDDEILRQSIADTIPVLFDLGFIRRKELSRMETSADLFMQQQAALIKSFATEKKEDKLEIKDIILSVIQNQLDAEFQRIDAANYGDVTTRRKAWLQQDRKRKATESAGDDIAVAIGADALGAEIVDQFISPEAHLVSQLAFINGIGKAIESAGHVDVAKGKFLYAKYEKIVLALWNKNIPEIRVALNKFFCRLRGLRVVDDALLKTLDINIPKLAGPFSENLKTMSADMAEVKEMVASVEKNAELSKYIYPVVLVFGSRLKGYGEQNADIDIAVFVRPGTNFSDREKLKSLLGETFNYEKIRGEVAEFWLEETASGLAIQDHGQRDPSIGSSHWSHVLFGAAWEGKSDAIREIREKLLVPYLPDDEKIIYGRGARGLYVEELERDTLQYRLMHKGYEKFFPAFGGMHTTHSDHIDGQSMFWDSGYRQTATKLFASRVFLPKISRP